MALFKKKPRQPAMTREQALNCRPVRNNVISWQTLDSGMVQIEYTMVLKPMLHAIFKRFSASQGMEPTRKIQLDSMGSMVWKMVDGHKSTADIIKTFAVEQNISNQESEQSITAFFRELGKRGLIGLH